MPSISIQGEGTSPRSRNYAPTVQKSPTNLSSRDYGHTCAKTTTPLPLNRLIFFTIGFFVLRAPWHDLTKTSSAAIGCHSPLLPIFLFHCLCVCSTHVSRHSRGGCLLYFFSSLVTVCLLVYPAIEYCRTCCRHCAILPSTRIS